MGFCIFNNVAIAVRHVQKVHQVHKVLIVDWDVHHGNGTQDILFGDPGVLYFSTHRSNFYPGTGNAPTGNAINAPLPAGSGDKAFFQAFDRLLAPAALEFKPQIVFISCGFDAHRDDPLGGMALSTAGFAELTRKVLKLARPSGGKIVSLLEGGYNLIALADCAVAHVRALSEEG